MATLLTPTPRPLSQPDIRTEGVPFTFSPCLHGVETPQAKDLFKPSFYPHIRAKSTLASMGFSSRRSSPGRKTALSSARAPPRLCYSRYSTVPQSRSSLLASPRQDNKSISEIDRLIEDCGNTLEQVKDEVRTVKTRGRNPFADMKGGDEWKKVFQSGEDYTNFFEGQAKMTYLSRNQAVTHFVNHKIGRPKPWRRMKEFENQRFTRIFLAWNSK